MVLEHWLLYDYAFGKSAHTLIYSLDSKALLKFETHLMDVGFLCITREKELVC
jgi:hypothetical protein